jgi:hypothetical protein
MLLSIQEQTFSPCIFFSAALELSSLAIKKDVLPQGKRLRLKCDIDSNGKAANVSIVMTVNYPPRGGQCEIYPQTGTRVFSLMEKVITTMYSPFYTDKLC